MTNYRADQLGSLLRPAALLEARADYEQSKIDLPALRAIEDREILVVLDQQRRIGLPIYSDGEFRRSSFIIDLQGAVEGLQPRPTSSLAWQGKGNAVLQTPAHAATSGPSGRLKQTRRLVDNDVAFLQEHSPGPFKITLPSPIQFTRLLHENDEPNSASRTEQLRDFVDIIRDEVQALIDSGVAYVQLDAPRYAYYMDPKLRQKLVDGGIDADAVLTEALEADNACIGLAHPAGIVTAFHVCRGNNRSQWFAEGGYDDIAERLFNTLDVDRFLLEYDSERSGSFEPLRFVPKGKTVVLGLVTTKEATMESQETLIRRIEEASKYVPIENLALSPQCGFASLAQGNLLSVEDQWRKLELVVETARKVWP